MANRCKRLLETSKNYLVPHTGRQKEQKRFFLSATPDKYNIHIIIFYSVRTFGATSVRFGTTIAQLATIILYKPTDTARLFDAITMRVHTSYTGSPCSLEAARSDRIPVECDRDVCSVFYPDAVF